MNFRQTLISETEFHILSKCIQIIGAKTYLEVGTYYGGTTHYLSLQHSDCLFFTINVTKEIYEASLANLPKYNNLLTKKEVGKLCKDDKNVIQIYGDTLNASTWKRLPNHMDMVFIDGCHLYKYVLGDSYNAIQLSPQIIIWHDFALSSVKSALDKYVSTWGDSIFKMKLQEVNMTIGGPKADICYDEIKNRKYK